MRLPRKSPGLGMTAPANAGEPGGLLGASLLSSINFFSRKIATGRSMIVPTM